MVENVHMVENARNLKQIALRFYRRKPKIPWRKHESNGEVLKKMEATLTEK